MTDHILGLESKISSLFSLHSPWSPQDCIFDLAALYESAINGEYFGSI